MCKNEIFNKNIIRVRKRYYSKKYHYFDIEFCLSDLEMYYSCNFKRVRSIKERKVPNEVRKQLQRVRSLLHRATSTINSILWFIILKCYHPLIISLFNANFVKIRMLQSIEYQILLHNDKNNIWIYKFHLEFTFFGSMILFLSRAMTEYSRVKKKKGMKGKDTQKRCSCQMHSQNRDKGLVFYGNSDKGRRDSLCKDELALKM